MKKILLSSAILLIVITTVGCTLYDKAHKIRTCQIFQNYDKIISIIHPNGEQYDFYAENSKDFKEGTYIRCSFNELKLDKEDYKVRIANPKPINVYLFGKIDVH